MEVLPGRGGAAEGVWQEPGHQGLIWGNTLTLSDFGACAGHIPGKTQETLQNPALWGTLLLNVPSPQVPEVLGSNPIPGTQPRGQREKNFRLGISTQAPGPSPHPQPKGPGSRAHLEPGPAGAHPLWPLPQPPRAARHPTASRTH